MTAVEKFMFETSFDAEPETPPEPVALEDTPVEEEVEEEIVPTFSEEEVELARREGYETGRQEGLAATEETLAKQINETLIRVDQNLVTAFQIQESANEELSRAAVSVALGICRKMLPTLAEKHAFGEVESVVTSVFDKIVEEPGVGIVVHPGVKDAVEQRFQELSSGKGYQGKITVQADETMEPGDCRIEWSNGGSERDSRTLWRDITAIVERNVGNQPTIWDEPDHLEEESVISADEDLSQEGPADDQTEEIQASETDD